jgi:hypothetical protein
MIARIVVGALPLAAAPPIDSAFAAGLSLRFTATFAHPHPTAAYVGAASGALAVDLVATGSTGTAAFRLDPDAGSCFATIGWALASATDGRRTRPLEMCIAGASFPAGDLAGYLAGARSAPDPSLVVPVVRSSPTTPFFNPAPVDAQIFVRGCTGDPYRKLGDLTVPVGGLALMPSTDAAGAAQLELLPATATVANVAIDVWADVLAACGGTDRMLPADPETGSTVDLAGTTIKPPPVPGPHVDLVVPRMLVDDLVSANVLAATLARSLTRRLEHAAAKLAEGRAVKAIRRLDGLVRRVDRLVLRAQLPSSAGQTLIGGAVAVQHDIATLAFTGPTRVLSGSCVAPPPCTATVWHVREPGGGIVPLPDGTPGRPFPSIAAALAAATLDGLCAIELQVRSGAYADDIVIDRPTTIVGESRGGVVFDGATVYNAGPYRLELVRATFDGSSILGALVVDDPCAATIVSEVSIDDAQRFGIWQRGGILEAIDLRITDTQGTGGDPAYGTAIYLHDGVQATLVTIEVLRSDAGALAAIGAGTDVSLNDGFLESLGVNPFFAADILDGTVATGLAAVEARDGAILDIEATFLSAGTHFGLWADDGAQVAVEDTTVTGTRTAGIAAGGATIGGHNIVATRAATVDLVNTHSRRAAVVGIAVAGGEIDHESGSVSRCLVGAYVASEEFDIGRLLGAAYIDNVRNLDAAALPLPAAVGGL